MQSLQLQELLLQTEFISAYFDTIKQDIQQQLTYAHYPDTPPSEYLERAVNLRIAFREMAEGIQAKRQLAQLQKQKIQKSKIFLEGLQYYKVTLMNKIKESQIDVIELGEYLDKPVSVSNWVQDFPSVQNHLNLQLEEKKNKKLKYQEMIRQKALKQQQSNDKKRLFEKILPDHARKLYDQIQETGKLFNIQEFDGLQEVNNRDLSILYDKFNPLRNNNTIELAYSKDQFQQIQINICTTDYKYYKQAKANKIDISQNPIKFSIANLAPQFNKLVIGLNRREDFNNEEVFHRLANNQATKQIFANPQNQFQRNINAKYVRLDWIQGMLLNGIISPHNLIQLIKERVFCLQLVAYLTQNIKKLNFFFPLVTENETFVANNIKKVSSGTLEKIKFQEYLSLVHVPSWVTKYVTTYQLLETQKNQMNLNEQMRQNISKSNFLSVIKAFKLQELADRNINSYFKGSFNIQQSILQFILIVPFSYPNQPSKINIIHWHSKKDQDKKCNYPNLPCKLARIPQTQISDRVLAIEKSVNEDISHFLKNQQNHPFRVLLQLNRLLSLLGDQSNN